jgi:hypothetical protein
MTLWSVIAWSLTLLGGALAAHSLFADRARGRKRCPGCWYSMDGAPTLTCPECGRTVKHAKRLFRTRRRWRRVVIAGFILALAYASATVDRAREHGWPGAVPTPLLALIAPTPSATSSRTGWMRILEAECMRRFTSEEAGGWHSALLSARVRADYWLAGRLGVSSEERRTLAALDLPLPELSSATLDDLAVAIEVACGVPLKFDSAALAAHGADTRAVSTFDGMTAREALDEATRSAVFGCRWAVDGGVVRVLPEADAASIGRLLVLPADAFGPDDLENDDARLSGVAQFITQFVTPNDWTFIGGSMAELSRVPGRLFIVAPVDSVVEIESLVELLRRNRDGGSRRIATGADDPSFQALAELHTRTTQALGADGTVTDVLSMIARDAGLPLVVDHGALAEVRLDLGELGFAPVDDSPRTISEALTEAMEGITWTNVDFPVWELHRGRILITTAQRASLFKTTALYDYRDLLGTPDFPREGIDTTWADRTGAFWLGTGLGSRAAQDTARLHVWHGRAIVRGTPRDHDIVERLLIDLRHQRALEAR